MRLGTRLDSGRSFSRLVLRLGMGNLRNMTKVVTTEQLYIHIQIDYNIYISYIQLLVMHLDQIIFLK